MEIGTVCVKLAGRDAGKTCVIVDVLDGGFVLVDGETRRRKVNRKHLVPVGKDVKVKKGASHDDVMAALGLTAKTAKAKPKKDKPAVKVRAKKAPKAKPAE